MQCMQHLTCITSFRLTYGEHMPKLHLAKTQAVEEALVTGHILELLVLQRYLSNSTVNLSEMSHLGPWLGITRLGTHLGT